MATLREHLTQATAALERAAIPSARLTAEVLLARLLGRERAYLYAHPEETLAPDMQTRLASWVERRALHVPLQYLTGVQEFYGREFAVSPSVLIPRPETELVVEAALERVPLEPAPGRHLRLADAGTGSGCIAATLKLERPCAHVLATDSSPAALEQARANAQRLGARIRFSHCDLLEAVNGPLDLVISNPPYLAQAEWSGLAPEVREHEPVDALVAGPTGTEVYARIVAQTAERLRSGGWLALELGFRSAPAVRSLLDPRSWSEVETRRDLQGWERVLLARRRT